MAKGVKKTEPTSTGGTEHLLRGGQRKGEFGEEENMVVHERKKRRKGGTRKILNKKKKGWGGESADGGNVGG